MENQELEIILKAIEDSKKELKEDIANLQSQITDIKKDIADILFITQVDLIRKDPRLSQSLPSHHLAQA